MNSVLDDPDIKINMSLDEIIHLTKGKNSKGFRTTRKNRRNPVKRAEEMLGTEHSVPLSSPWGLDIYVSKQSPLLSAEQRRRIAQAVSNRVSNSNLIQKTKKIIPAEYKLVRTTQGVERVLVPAASCSLKPPRQKLLRPRKLKYNGPNEQMPDTPPPLIAASIFQPTLQPEENGKAGVPEPEIIVIEPPKCKKDSEIIDVEDDLPEDLLEAKKMCIPAPISGPQSSSRTLNDRFTMLIKNSKS